MQKAIAAIVILLLSLSLPVAAAEGLSETEGHQVTAATPIDEVAIGSALTVTRTQTVTWTGLEITITPTPRVIGHEFNTASGCRPI